MALISMNSNINQIHDNLSAYDEDKKFTLKVLFGHMFGCELHLPADDYFLIINPGLPLDETAALPESGIEHGATYTHNTLYLPCDMPSPNIILRLSRTIEDEDNENSYHLEIQSLEDSFSTQLRENEIFTHAHVRFAIKRSKDQWAENIKNFHLASVVNTEQNEQEKLGNSHDKKRLTVAMSSLAIAVLLIAAAGFWFNIIENDRLILTLNEVLAGSPYPLDIVKGREDNKIYVLASHYQAMKWAQVALFKLQEKSSTVPVWLYELRKEVITHLSNAGYPISQIDYTQSQHPVISLYQALTPHEEEKLKTLALNTIPFALDIKTRVKTKPQLLQDARQGLDRLHIHYRQINTSTGYALVVRDALSDHALLALQKFIQEFTRQWGNNVINFSINLNDNWLQDKSYLDSSNGYLFLNPRHWYFPLNKEI